MERCRANYKVLLPISGLCIISGSIIYILFRPSSLLMFRWFNDLSLMHSIHYLREVSQGIDRHLPTWVINSAPFALWVLAYSFLIESIWGGLRNRSKTFWHLLIPIIAFFTEVAQTATIIPGKFDWIDLLLLLLAIYFAYTIIAIIRLEKEIK